MSSRSVVLQRLLDKTPDSEYLSINVQSGVCYAIAVIDSEGDELAVLEGDDLTDELINAGTRVCKGRDNGAYEWPEQTA